MEVTLAKIYGKTHDYKLCKSCNNINYYANEVCVHCGGDSFDERDAGIVKYLESEYEYLESEYEMTEVEIDNFEKQV